MMLKDDYENLTAKNICIFITVMACCLYILPFLLLRDMTYIHVHDNLDGAFLFHHHLANHGHILTFNTDITFENLMNGLPIGCLPSTSFTVLLFYLFGSLAGYIINDIIVHSIGFIGMYLLLRKYFIRESKNQYIVIALSLCFAMVPFDTIIGLSVSGQPLLLYVFLNILNRKQKVKDYIFIVLFPFYSWFAVAGVSIAFALGVILFVDIIRNRVFNFQFLIWFVIFIILYCVSNYHLLYTFFWGDFISHRVEWNMSKNIELDFILYCKKALGLFLQTHYHSGLFKTFSVIFAFFAALVISFHRKRFNTILFWLFLAIIGICLFYGFYPYFVWGMGLGDFLPLLKTFQADRFYFLLPFLWFLLFAVSLNKISKVKKYNWFICFLLILHLICVGSYNRDYQYNVVRMIAKIIPLEFGNFAKTIYCKHPPPNFKQFFAESLFQKVANYIDKPKNTYRVVSIGMHPSIAQYNSFYTLDGYQVIYPLKYKHNFRKIIVNELEKNEFLKKYFDLWGNRCYVFVAELRDKCFLECYKNELHSVDNLEINTNALKKLGGRYIFSAVSINNYEKLNLTFEKLFEDEESYWRIYLYKVN